MDPFNQDPGASARKATTDAVKSEEARRKHTAAVNAGIEAVHKQEQAAVEAGQEMRDHLRDDPHSYPATPPSPVKGPVKIDYSRFASSSSADGGGDTIGLWLVRLFV